MYERNFKVLQDLLSLKSSKVGRIDSSHKKLVKPHIYNWLNNTVASVTLYTQVELLFGAQRNNVSKMFTKFTERGDET
jgi:hypothetical protein